jgi:hypothetical protein
MLIIIQHFGKHCSCHLQGIMVGCFWEPYIGQAVHGVLDLMMLIGGVEEQVAIQQMSSWLRKRGDEKIV